MEHRFEGKWITNEEFARLAPRNVFHRQREPLELPCVEHRDRHILFRRRFTLKEITGDETVFISADDYVKLYLNGQFVCQGPAPSYHFQYNYMEVNVSAFLREGENVLAAHTLYQGLINRVWQSGDLRHGMILDLVQNGRTVLASDPSFLTADHDAYTETGVCGYDTQFLERYDSRAAAVGFERPDFSDHNWKNASLCAFDDHVLVPQKTASLVTEIVSPVQTQHRGGTQIIDFGSIYVGYLSLTARGRAGDTLIVRCGQELNEDGSVRFDLRANCRYEEEWILSGETDRLDWFDYKSFRYAEIVLPEGAEAAEISLTARHYPFTLRRALEPGYAQSADLRAVWDLCVRSQQYGVQEVIQDCMEREKGFYLGDGCYTALTNAILTKDDSMLRKLISDAFTTSFITDTLITCMDCSLMHEIAEFPLILVSAVLWHFRLTNDEDYLKENAPKVFALLDAYRRKYEKDGLLRDMDKWCVVEWPANFRHGYDVELPQDRTCRPAHVALNAYYLEAIRNANKIARLVHLPDYRDETPVFDAFCRAFYDPERHAFRDGEQTEHISLVGNAFAFGFDLFPKKAGEDLFLHELTKQGIASLSLFCVFPVFTGLIRKKKGDLLKQMLADPRAWRRILSEDGFVTFEGWGRDTKWNTSLFHLTLSYAAAFMTDADTDYLFS